MGTQDIAGSIEKILGHTARSTLLTAHKEFNFRDVLDDFVTMSASSYEFNARSKVIRTWLGKQ